MAKSPCSNSKDYENGVVLPRRCFLTWTVGVVVFLAGVVLLWPWNPAVKMARLTVRRVKVHPLPPVGADVYMSVTVSVHNMDVYWMEVKEVDVGLKYRGKKMGHVESKGCHVRAWGSSHVSGDLESNSLPSADVALLLKDLAKGRVHFHTVTEVVGHLGLLFYPFPSTFKAILACDVLVDSKNHTIVHQHCIHKD